MPDRPSVLCGAIRRSNMRQRKGIGVGARLRGWALPVGGWARLPKYPGQTPARCGLCSSWPSAGARPWPALGPVGESSPRPPPGQSQEGEVVLPWPDTGHSQLTGPQGRRGDSGGCFGPCHLFWEPQRFAQIPPQRGVREGGACSSSWWPLQGSRPPAWLHLTSSCWPLDCHKPGLGFMARPHQPSPGPALGPEGTGASKRAFRPLPFPVASAALPQSLG